MKKIIFTMAVLLGALMISAPLFATGSGKCTTAKAKATCAPGQKADKAGKKTTCIMWTCPMHADVLSAKPGKCPKCGMNLEKKIIKKGVEKITTAPKKAVATVWTCPMHPEVRSDKPGKCPKCGMNLEKAEK
jgi:hypothetical protein